jgi:hypothetical protein
MRSERIIGHLFPRVLKIPDQILINRLALIALEFLHKISSTQVEWATSPPHQMPPHHYPHHGGTEHNEECWDHAHERMLRRVGTDDKFRTLQWWRN